MMESPEVLREPAVAVPQSRDGTVSAARPKFSVVEVSDAVSDADTPRGALPRARLPQRP